MYLANEKNSSIRRCAFCKHWYDPTNSAIQPKGGKDMWEYDGNVKNKCREKNVITNGVHSCFKFESKL